jgi:hypothetical protein
MRRVHVRQVTDSQGVLVHREGDGKGRTIGKPIVLQVNLDRSAVGFYTDKTPLTEGSVPLRRGRDHEVDILLASTETTAPTTGAALRIAARRARVDDDGNVYLQEQKHETPRLIG